MKDSTTNSSPAQEDFKVCQVCGQTWASRSDFLVDSKVTLSSYHVNFDALENGYFLFIHTCEARLTLAVAELSDLYDGPIFEQRKTGNEECPGYCLYPHELSPCTAECECAYVREIMQLFACEA